MDNRPIFLNDDQKRANAVLARDNKVYHPRFVYPINVTDFARVIPYERIASEETVEKLNAEVSNSYRSSPFDVMPCIHNLFGLTGELIDGIDDRVQFFQVKDADYVARETELICKDEAILRDPATGEVIETVEDYLENLNIYTRQELKAIIAKMEQIESGLDELDGLDNGKFIKQVVMYDRLKRHLSYDYHTREKSSFDTRSLRGLLTGKTVCVGYATILKAMLDRQGIECDHITGNGHSWIVSTFNGKRYPLDITWDSTAYNRGARGMASMKNFGQDIETFNRKHNDEYRDVIQKLPPEELSAYNTQDIENALRYSESNMVIGNQGDLSYNQAQFIEKRRDGSSFYIAQLSSCNIPTKGGAGTQVHKYIYIPMEAGMLDRSQMRIVYSTTSLSDINTNINVKQYLGAPGSILKEYLFQKNCFVNDLMSRENIERVRQQGSSLLGSVEYSYRDNGYVLRVDHQAETLPIFRGFQDRCIDGKILEKDDASGSNKYTCYSVGEDLCLQKESISSYTDLFKLPVHLASEVLDRVRTRQVPLGKSRYIREISCVSQDDDISKLQ